MADTVRLFLLVLNIPLFLYGLKKQGALFTLYAIYTVCIYSLTAWLITDVLPVDVSFASPLAGQDLLLCALFGGLISGVGSGMAIRFGGAMDGIEVMAVIFAKRLGVTVGTFVMIYNVILYIICGIVLQNWILPLYSIVTYGAALKTVDFIVDGLDRAKCAVIITTRADEVCKVLTDTFECGATRLEARGGYSNTPKSMIYFCGQPLPGDQAQGPVHEVDETAYITISEVADVFFRQQLNAAESACAQKSTGAFFSHGRNAAKKEKMHGAAWLLAVIPARGIVVSEVGGAGPGQLPHRRECRGYRCTPPVGHTHPLLQRQTEADRCPLPAWPLFPRR